MFAKQVRWWDFESCIIIIMTAHAIIAILSLLIEYNLLSL